MKRGRGRRGKRKSSAPGAQPERNERRHSLASGAASGAAARKRSNMYRTWSGVEAPVDKEKKFSVNKSLKSIIKRGLSPWRGAAKEETAELQKEEDNADIQPVVITKDLPIMVRMVLRIHQKYGLVLFVKIFLHSILLNTQAVSLPIELIW